MATKNVVKAQGKADERATCKLIINELRKHDPTVQNNILDTVLKEIGADRHNTYVERQVQYNKAGEDLKQFIGQTQYVEKAMAENAELKSRSSRL